MRYDCGTTITALTTEEFMADIITDYAELFNDPTVAVIDLIYTYNTDNTGVRDDRTRVDATTYTVRYTRTRTSESEVRADTGFVRLGAERFALHGEDHLIRESASRGHARLTGYRVVERFV
jgi:hypothetical protein